MRIIDLSYPIHEGMQTFPVPWHPMTEITQLGRHGIENRETRKLTIGTHSGTHIDAPLHFIPQGLPVDSISLDTLIGPATLADFSWCTDKQELDVRDFEKALGEASPTRLILRFDWSRHWGTNHFYSHHPYISEEAAHWLIGRGVRVLGMDTPQVDSPDHGRNSTKDSPIHKIMLAQRVVFIEYLTNLDQIDQTTFELLAMPLNIKGADGAPSRVAARLENYKSP